MANNVIWFEVTGQDADKLQGFYGSMFGWTFEEEPTVPGYGMVPCPPKGEAGIPGGVGAAMGQPKGWITFYVGVDDLDATLVRAEGQGSEILQPATPLPGGSRIAVISDPEGRPLGLVQEASA